MIIINLKIIQEGISSYNKVKRLENSQSRKQVEITQTVKNTYFRLQILTKINNILRSIDSWQSTRIGDKNKNMPAYCWSVAALSYHAETEKIISVLLVGAVWNRWWILMTSNVIHESSRQKFNGENLDITKLYKLWIISCLSLVNWGKANVHKEKQEEFTESKVWGRIKNCLEC